MARAKGFDPLFVGDADRCLFLLELGATVGVTGWRCLAYCLMTTHYHLLVQTPTPNLAAGMWRLNGRYAAGFNRRHGGRGHVFGGRYKAVPVLREAHLLELLRYIALNPVRDGQVAAPSRWRWSSYGATAAGAATASFVAHDDVEALFGGGAHVARRRYTAFVEEAA